MSSEENKYAFLASALQARKNNDSYRELTVNQDLVDFSSNDYLGFAQSVDSFLEEDQCKSTGSKLFKGSSGSRLLTGNSAEIEALEEQVAAFHNADVGLLFNSGYDANLGFFSCVPQRSDVVLYDELVHASIRDGIRLGTARSYSFQHNDIGSLQERLAFVAQRYGYETRVFVAVESVYSMDGDSAPLAEIAHCLQAEHHHLVVDEAHAVGVIGPGGVGAVVEAAIESQVFARVITFGKALGSHGAMVLGDSVLRDYLINFSRPFIYTTALSKHAVLSIKTGYDILSSSDFNELLISILINSFNSKVEALGLNGFIPSKSAIHCIKIPGNQQVKGVATALQEAGYDVRPILHPTVAEGSERLRVCLHTFNTPNQIDGLLTKLKALI